jgi:hypothetical protein
VVSYEITQKPGSAKNPKQEVIMGTKGRKNVKKPKQNKEKKK